MYPLPFCIDIRNRSCVDLSAFAAGLGRFGGNEAVSPAWQQGYRRFTMEIVYEEEYDVTDNGIRSDLLL